MLDVSWTELLLIAVVALVVLGPKDLPKAMRFCARWVRKARGMMREFQGHVDEMMRESELDEVRKELNKVSSVDLDREIERTIDPGGSIKQALDLEGPAASPPPPPAETEAAAEPPATAPSATADGEASPSPGARRANA